MIAHDRRPVRPDPPARTSRSCPSTSGARRPTRRSATDRSTRRSSAAARTRRSNGRPASTSGSSATRTTGASRAPPDQIVIQFFRTADTMVQALKTGEHRLRPRRQRRPVRRAQGRAEHLTVAGRPTAGPSSAFNTYGTGTGKTSRRRPVDQGAPRPGVPRRPRLRHRQADAGRPGPRRLRRRRHDAGPAGPWRRKWHIEPTNLRTFDIEVAEAEADRGRLQLDASGQRLDKEGKPISLRLVMPDSTTELPQGRPVHRGLVRADRDQGDHQRPRRGRRSTTSMLPPEADPPGNGRLRHVHLGLAASPDPNALLQIFTATRSAARPTACGANPNYDELYDEAEHAADDQERKAIIDRDAAVLVRPGAVPHPVLRRQAARLPDRQVRRLAEPADRSGTPLFAYGTLNYTLLTDASAAAPVAAPSARLRRRRPGAAAGAVAARHRRRRRLQSAATARLIAGRRRHGRRWSSVGSSSSAGGRRPRTTRSRGRRRMSATGEGRIAGPLR